MNLRSAFLPLSWLAAALALACSAAHAAPADSSPSAAKAKPAAAAPGGKTPAAEPDTLILSDSLNYNDAKKESTFTGNVVMTRGPMTLRADKLVMHEDAQGSQFGTATVNPGNLVFVRQETPEKFEVVEARGLRAEYNGKTKEIEMIGNAVVTKFVCGKPFDKISGDRVKYNQETNIYEAFSKPGAAPTQGGRVRSIATPSAKAEAAAADCRKKSAKH
jgi:lipopolysaccharide export system protein LptA